MKFQNVVKRTIDIICSGLGLIVFSPILLITAVLIRIKLGSPIFFTQDRLGKDDSGLRPGEKLYEELLMSEEGLTKTANSKIFIGKPVEFDSKKVMDHLEVLKRIVDNEDVELIDSVMRAFVTTYIRPEDVNGGEKSNEVSKCS